MKLNIEEIEKLSKAFYDKYAGKGLTPSEVMELHKCEYWNTILDAQLSALASTPDEGLRELVAAYLQFEEQKKMPPSWSDVQKKHQLGRAAAILSLVQPVITALRAKLAGAEKEKQQAIKVNNVSWEGKLQGKIDYAVEQERKAIGEYLESLNWNPNYHGAYIIPRPSMRGLVQMLKRGEFFSRGESLEVKHDQ